MNACILPRRRDRVDDIDYPSIARVFGDTATDATEHEGAASIATDIDRQTRRTESDFVPTP